MKNSQSNINFDIYDNYPIIAGFNSRLGGISKGVYESLNLGFSTGDDREIVIKNHEIYASILGLDYTKMVLSHQVHKDNILIASSNHAGMGLIKDRDYNEVDAIYTEEKGLPILTGHADCAPIFFYDKKRQAIALAHSGWQGTVLQIVRKVIDLFLERGSNTSDILCAIGPAICMDCYEIGDEVLRQFDLDLLKNNKAYFFNKFSGKAHIDLKMINKAILREAGILEYNIELSKYCTKCRDDLFYSHRRSDKQRGAHAACMCLL